MKPQISKGGKKGRKFRAIAITAKGIQLLYDMHAAGFNRCVESKLLYWRSQRCQIGRKMREYYFSRIAIEKMHRATV